MILEFKVENFRSFKEEQILSFEATSDTLAEEYFCVQKPKVKILKMAVVYGANASGKSNLLTALDYLRFLIIMPKNDKKLKTDFVPFLLDNSSRQKPGRFEITFFINDTKYIYSLKLNNDIIIEETLNYYPSTRSANIFRRLDDNGLAKIEVGPRMKLKKADEAVLQGNTLPNMTVVSAFAKSNIVFPELEKVYNYFLDGFKTIIRSDISLFNWATQYIQESNIDKKIIIDLLSKADFNIVNFEIKEEEIEFEYEDKPILQVFKQLFKKKSEELTQGFFKTLTVDFSHSVKSNPTEEVFLLSPDNESDGTLRYFGLATMMMLLIEENTFLPIDELENSLHPDLFTHFINTFLMNSKESQLLFTTHNVNFLEFDDLRKDVVWFTEKKEDASTQLFALEEFDIRKDLSYSKAYKTGKFGAKPNLSIFK